MLQSAFRSNCLNIMSFQILKHLFSFVHIIFVIVLMRSPSETMFLFCLIFLCALSTHQAILNQYCGLIFVPLALLMVNDDSTKCKKMAALAARALLGKVNVQQKDLMFSLATQWLNNKEVIANIFSIPCC